MTIKKQMDAIYRDLAPDEIPWNIEEPPGVLVDLVESDWVRPCDAADLGCGAGNHALWLASRGFRMTGIDISSEAVDVATRLASARDESVRFIARDLTGVVDDLEASFDFAYDWKVLHHVFPEHREQWAANVHRMLRPGGRYLSLCFSDQEPTGFDGGGKHRTTPLGTTLYLSSQEEVHEMFEPFFAIESISTVMVPGRTSPHTAIKTLMVRR